jgi:nucleoside-diphosphate-sugar epimerase
LTSEETESVVRLPQVHDTVQQGLITYAVQVAREKGVSAYTGEGRNRWPAAHVQDVAYLYRLALEKREAGSRYNAVAEEGIPMREIAAVIGKGLKAACRQPSSREGASSLWLACDIRWLRHAGFQCANTKHLGWNPTGPGLIADLENIQYFQA